MNRSAMTAGVEWRQFWPLVMASAIGYSITGIHIYSLGAFMEPLQEEFGWARSQISVGLMIAGLVGAGLSIPFGMLVDRFGSRILALMGITLISMAFALLGTTTGTTENWVILWLVFGLANVATQATVWVKAIASCFERSRGLALAVTLSGSSIGATIFPLLATWLIGYLGWRAAFPAMAAIWAALTLPFVLKFFRVPKEKMPNIQKTESVVLSGTSGFTLKESMRISAFYKLLFTSALVVFTIVGTIVHFIPLVTDYGADPLRAAGTASLIGVFSIIGRLVTGLLLDRFQGHLVGAGVFIVPLLGTTLLLLEGANPVNQAIAAACFGFTLGSEIDVMAYLTTRYLGVRHFGALFGAMVGALVLGAALGPVAAGAVYDGFGNYVPFLITTMVASFAASLALATLGRPRF
jgi:MFS family permease